MEFRSRKLIKPEDLNASGNLFGGKVLLWIDEEAAIYAMCQLGTKNIVTKIISEVNFVSPAKQGDIIEIGVEYIHFGKSSITLRVIVRNKETSNQIIRIDKMVFVHIDENGKPIPHNKKDPRIGSILSEIYQCQRMYDECPPEDVIDRGSMAYRIESLKEELKDLGYEE